MSRRDEERRRDIRIDYPIVVSYECGDVQRWGVTINLSETGLYLQTDQVLEVGTQFRMKIEASTRFLLTGEVQWVRSAMDPLRPSGIAGMGVQLHSPSKEWRLFIRSLRKTRAKNWRHREKRQPYRGRIRFGPGAICMRAHTDNLSRGGVFIATEEPLGRGTTIEGEVALPGKKAPVRIKGKVSYRVDQLKSQETGHPQGVGIRFTQLETWEEANLKHFLNRLKIHRSRVHSTLR